MRAILISIMAAIAIGIHVLPAAAAEAAVVAPPPNATPLPRVAQYYGWHGYRPACPYGYYFDCRIAPSGLAQCACWRDGWWW